MTRRFCRGILGAAALLVAHSPHAIIADEEICFQLEKPGFVTLALDDANGMRVRNLIGGKWFEAGLQSEPWNGLDDVGNPLPAGIYRWKGIIHQGLTAEFEAAFNSPGDPPWNTAQIAPQRNVRASGDGGWLSDHQPPLCAYADGGHVYFGAKVAEAGHSIMELDLEGRKTWGTLWLGLSGASAISGKDGILYVAGEKGWMKDDLAVHRLNAETHKLLPNPPEAGAAPGETAFIKASSEEFSDIKGMAVTSRFVVLALGDQNRLALFDSQSGKHVKDIPLPEAGAVAEADAGSLFAISGGQVVRVDLENGRRHTLIAGPLGKAMGLAVSANGSILISDAGEAEQCVKIFSPEGNLTGTIGKPGGRKEGPFDPEAMNCPGALAVDAKDHVWVGEFSFLPKRIGVWTMDGKLLRDWTGPPQYGGGGMLDPRNAKRAFYRGMEFSVALWPEPSTLKAVLFNPKDHEDLPCAALFPQAPVYWGNHLYLLNNEGWSASAMLIGELESGRLIPRVVFGPLQTLCKAWEKSHPDFIKPIAASIQKGQGVFLWQDLNSDGQATPSEVALQPDWTFGAMWGMHSWPTLNLYAKSADRTCVIEVAPDAESDSLRYRLDTAKRIPLPDEVVKRGITALSPDTEGNLLVNTGQEKQQGDEGNFFYSIAPSGRVNWTYPNPYPANWHNSPRPKPGDIQHTLNVEGVAFLGGSIGNIFQLNGNKGVRYLFTTDGLFVGQLYGDARNAPPLSSCREVAPGLRLDGYSLGDECFQGWFGKTQDGGIFQIVGKDSSNVVKVCGLSTLQRLAGGDIHLKQSAAVVQKSTPPAPPPIEAVQMGGIAKGWEKIKKYRLLDEDCAAWFAIGYRPGGLSLSLTMEKCRPFANAGENPKALFKTGNAVDLRVSVATDASPARSAPVPGDQRFLFSTWRGKPVAVRYRFVVPNADASLKAKFASPCGDEVVDEVTVVKDSVVRIDEIPSGWRLTAFLPWSALGLSKPPTGSLLGDVGVLLADPEGTRTVARHYYFDRGSQVVSDLPSEVQVNPSRWGKIQF